MASQLALNQLFEVRILAREPLRLHSKKHLRSFYIKSHDYYTIKFMKKISLLLVVIICLIAIFQGIFKIYKVDVANTCQWKNGKIVLSTVMIAKVKYVLVRRSNETEFIKRSEKNGVCIY